MALVACPDCQKQVSTNAAACPNCGRKMKSAKPIWVVACKAVGAVAMLWGVIGGATACGRGHFDDAIPGIIVFVIGMLVFVAGRFGE